MHDTAFEIFMEENCNTVQTCITELVTDTWLECFVLDPIGQYAAVVAIALILSLCVGRFHVTVDAWKVVVDNTLARFKDNIARGSGDGAPHGDDPSNSSFGDILKNVLNKNEIRDLANRLQNVHLSTPKKSLSLEPLVRPQRNPSVLIERDANTMSHLEYQTPPREIFHTTTEGNPETIRKRNEQLDRLRMWS